MKVFIEVSVVFNSHLIKSIHNSVFFQNSFYHKTSYIETDSLLNMALEDDDFLENILNDPSTIILDNRFGSTCTSTTSLEEHVQSSIPKNTTMKGV